eukprot:2167540-Pleurochrysis_carterae.AAC.2
MQPCTRHHCWLSGRRQNRAWELAHLADLLEQMHRLDSARLVVLFVVHGQIVDHKVPEPDAARVE